MTWQMWTVCGVIFGALLILLTTRYTSYIVLWGAVTVLVGTGIIDEADLLAGVGNEGVVTIGVLFVMVVGLRNTGAVSWLAQSGLGLPKTYPGALLRMMLPVGIVSAFMNNTPLVAVMLPIIHDWAKKLRMAPSLLMIPLSYGSILGGMCTLVGTSTILVIHGLMEQSNNAADSPFAEVGTLTLFDIAWIGMPCFLVGMVYFALFGRWVLPNRSAAIDLDREDPREYTVEMIVDVNGPLVNQTIKSAGLRHLPGLFLVQIRRDNEIMPAVSSQVKLKGGDRLVFAGVITSVLDLQRIRGLSVATSQVYKVDARLGDRVMVEAVVSSHCPLIGKTIREGQFRTYYNAAVIAVARSGYRLAGKKLGDIVLEPGDTLLLEARKNFIEQNRNTRDFYLVSSASDDLRPRYERAPIAFVILLLMIGLVIGAGTSLLYASLVAAGLMLVTGCANRRGLLNQVDWPVLLVVAAMVVMGRAIVNSGVDVRVAEMLLYIGSDNAYIALGALMGMTLLFANVMNAMAGGVLMFPIAVQMAETLSVSPLPMVIAVMIGGASSFVTPIGYQTNLMVAGPGGYRFVDYIRAGLPLTLLIWGLSIWLIPLIWPFVLPVTG